MTQPTQTLHFVGLYGDGTPAAGARVLAAAMPNQSLNPALVSVQKLYDILDTTGSGSLTLLCGVSYRIQASWWGEAQTITVTQDAQANYADYLPGTLAPSAGALKTVSKPGDMGVWVGATPPSPATVTTFAQWLVNRIGYWCWWDTTSVQSGVVHLGGGGGSSTSAGIWYGTQDEYDALDPSLKVAYSTWLTTGTGYFEFHIFTSSATNALVADPISVSSLLDPAGLVGVLASQGLSLASALSSAETVGVLDAQGFTLTSTLGSAEALGSNSLVADPLFVAASFGGADATGVLDAQSLSVAATLSGADLYSAVLGSIVTTGGEQLTAAVSADAIIVWSVAAVSAGAATSINTISGETVQATLSADSVLEWVVVTFVPGTVSSLIATTGEILQATLTPDGVLEWRVA